MSNFCERDLIPAHILVGGLVFCLGLILVIVAGAELFTGNNLIVMAWADGLISTRHVLRNWTIVYLGNFVGSVMVGLVYWFIVTTQQPELWPVSDRATSGTVRDRPELLSSYGLFTSARGCWPKSTNRAGRFSARD